MERIGDWPRRDVSFLMVSWISPLPGLPPSNPGSSFMPLGLTPPPLRSFRPRGRDAPWSGGTSLPARIPLVDKGRSRSPSDGPRRPRDSARRPGGRTDAGWASCGEVANLASHSQNGGIQAHVPGPTGLPETERRRGPSHAGNAGDSSDQSGHCRRKTRTEWPRLHCLKPNPDRSSSRSARHTGYCGVTPCNDRPFSSRAEALLRQMPAGEIPGSEPGRRDEWAA